MCGVDFTDKLDSDEYLKGTPTVVQVGGADLTIGDVGRNSAIVTIFTRDVAISRAVTFSVQGQSAGVYTLRVTVSTDNTPARTLVRDIDFEAL